MKYMKQGKRKYSEEQVIKIGSEYNSRTEFYKNNVTAYKNATYYGMLDILFPESKKETITIEYAIEECKKYKNRTQISKNDFRLFYFLYNEKLLDKLFPIEKTIKWTDDLAIEYAKKFTNLSKFKKTYSGAYKYISKYKLEYIAYEHMEITGDLYNRGIYTYKIYYKGKKYAYSGLTWNFEERYNDHLSRIKNKKRPATGVDYFCMDKNIELPIYEIYSDYVDIKLAKKLEGENEKLLKEQGFIILNKQKTGGTGGTGGKTIFYTKEYAENFIKDNNIKFRNELKKINRPLYRYCSKNNIIEDLLPDKKLRKLSYEYLKKFIKENNIKYYYELNNLNTSLYQYGIKKDFLKDFLIKRNNKRTVEVATQFIKDNNINSRSDFQGLNKSLYEYCLKTKNKNGVKYIDILIPNKKIRYTFDFAEKYIKDNNIRYRSELYKIKNSLYNFCIKTKNKNNVKYIDILLPKKKVNKFI